METGGGEIQRVLRQRLGENTGPLVLVFCLQHQEWPVRRQESRPLPRRAHQSVPMEGRTEKGGIQTYSTPPFAGISYQECNDFH